MIKDMERNKISNVTLSSVFIRMCGLQAPETGGEVWRKEHIPSVEEFADDKNWEK